MTNSVIKKRSKERSVVVLELAEMRGSTKAAAILKAMQEAAKYKNIHAIRLTRNAFTYPPLAI
jgi:hypothetical protein